MRWFFKLYVFISGFSLEFVIGICFFVFFGDLALVLAVDREGENGVNQLGRELPLRKKKI
jgi:hypothetical protein